MEARADTADSPWHNRVDRGELLAAHRREDGTLLVEGYACREGVLTYVRADGSTFREFVPLETIRESATGLGRLPVTLEHPSEDVSPKTYKRDAIGDTDGEVEIGDGGFTKVRIAVRDEGAIAAVERGKQELSPGYAVQLDSLPGTHPVHGSYDATQIRRRYNHLAIVDAARGGHTVRLRADAAYATTTIANSTGGTSASTTRRDNPSRGAPVNSRLIPVLSLLGITRRIDSDDAAIEAVEAALRARKDAEEEAAAAAEEEAAAKEAEGKSALDTLQAKYDELRLAFDTLKAKHDEMTAAAAKEEEKADRADLVVLAKRFNLDESKHPANADLKKAIAKAHLPTMRADATDAYVDAVVDLAKAAKGREDSKGSGRPAGRAAWDQPRNDADPANTNGQRSDAKPLSAGAHSRAQRDAAFIGNQTTNGGAK